LLQIARRALGAAGKAGRLNPVAVLSHTARAAGVTLIRRDACPPSAGFVELGLALLPCLFIRNLFLAADAVSTKPRGAASVTAKTAINILLLDIVSLPKLAPECLVPSGCQLYFDVNQPPSNDAN